MTLKELHDATAALGFEDELESSNGFFAAANRAIYCANRIRPKTAELEIYLPDDAPSYGDKEINGKAYKRIDASRVCDNFLCFSPTAAFYGAIPLTEDKDFIITGKTTLLLACEREGLYRIRYYQKLRRLTLDDEDMEIDLDEDICQILPLLVASYVWLEDEEEKADKYKSLFYSEAARLESFSKKSHTCAYNTEGGWSV